MPPFPNILHNLTNTPRPIPFFNILQPTPQVELTIFFLFY